MGPNMQQAENTLPIICFDEMPGISYFYQQYT